MSVCPPRTCSFKLKRLYGLEKLSLKLRLLVSIMWVESFMATFFDVSILKVSLLPPFKLNEQIPLGSPIQVLLAESSMISRLRDSSCVPSACLALFSSILFNHSSSIQADKNYQTSIADPDNYFPSPSAFVYTLPNIVTGEIAIRHHIQGETSFYILQEKDEQMMNMIIEASFADTGTRRILCGWIDAEDDDHFEAELTIREKTDKKID